MLKRSKKILALLVCILMIAMLPCTAYAGYGNVGYHCYKKNPSSGMVIIGDSNCCQMWGYQNSSASYCSTWGGHYGYGSGIGLQINSNSYVAQMKVLIRDTLKRKGRCTVYVCGTSNDDDNSYSAYNCMSLIRNLNSYFSKNKVNGKRPVFYAVSAVGDRGYHMNAYNNALRKYVSNYKSSYVKYTSIENCLTGSNGGFLDDDTHYNNATLKKILTRFKKLA